MKTQIVTIFAALVLSSGIAKTTYAATPAKNTTYTVVTGISAINKIEVHGNVELYVSDGNTDQVKVYNNYYNQSALVQGKNGVLRISSYKTEKLVVWVTANDLRVITAFDNAEVKSFGNLSKIDFTVDLHNNATAKLNLDAFTAIVTIHDDARAYLSGTANDYDLKYNRPENICETGFVAQHALKTLTTKKVVAKTDLDELANL